jgi:hypothetical protein
LKRQLETEVKFGHGRRLCLKACLSITLSLVTLRVSDARHIHFCPDSPGYLATVGPNSLRFQEPVVEKPAPPPEMTNDAPPVVSVPLPEPPKQKPAVTDVDASMNNQLPVPDSITGTNQVSAIPMSGIPAQNNDVVSPQMLLKFFNKGTNAIGQVYVPIGSAVVNPSEPLKSKATYTIGQ